MNKKIFKLSGSNGLYRFNDKTQVETYDYGAWRPTNENLTKAVLEGKVQITPVVSCRAIDEYIKTTQEEKL